ncbi:MAG: RluA family pseudouridine synthase [Oscillospiraceae bacterium]|nr:RluA family pseudouridine synthase [Oscillospiraceae bacterium]
MAAFFPSGHKRRGIFLEELTFTVPAAYDGRTVHDFLRREQGISSRLLKKLKREAPPGGLFRNGVLVRTVDQVQKGDRLLLRWREEGAGPAASAETVQVLYEDGALVVFNKPWDMPCHPAKRHQGDTLGNVFAARCAANGQTLPFRAVNRLDKDTTGIVVAAKNQFAASRLAGRVEKEYLAILCGIPQPPVGTVDAPIGRPDPVHILRQVLPDGQRAVTHYETLAAAEDYSLVRLRLETGRTHQIRVHMAHIGHPLAGDALYGGDSRIIGRQALHCAVCRFVHPVSQKQMKILAPMHEPFKNALKNAYISVNIE